MEILVIILIVLVIVNINIANSKKKLELKKMVCIFCLLTLVVASTLFILNITNVEQKGTSLQKIPTNSISSTTTLIDVKENQSRTSNETKKAYTVNTEELFSLIDSYMTAAISSYSYLTYSSNSNARSKMYEITIRSNKKFSKKEFDKIKLNITKNMFESLKQNSYLGGFTSDNSIVCINFNLYVKEEKRYSRDWKSISLLYLSKNDADLLMDFEQFYEKKGY